MFTPGEIDDRFYVVVNGCVRVESAAPNPRAGSRSVDASARPSFAEGSRRDIFTEAEGPLTLLKVTATLLEQASISCQLRFHKVFLRELDRAGCSAAEEDRREYSDQ